MTLVDAYYFSQIGLAVTAVIAAGFGYGQLRSSNRYELLKKLEDEQVRKARRLLWNELRAKQPQPLWWKDDKLEEAASTVCASFDIVGLMARHGNYRFFSKQWAPVICWTYQALQEYIAERNRNRPRAFDNYRKLYERAKLSKREAGMSNWIRTRIIEPMSLSVKEINARLDHCGEDEPAKSDKPDDTSKTALTPQAVAVHKLLYDQVDFLKKQQWTITSYVSIVYGAIFALTAKELSPWQIGSLVAATAVAAIYGIYLLAIVQCHLGQARIRLDKANLEIFDSSEWDKLQMRVERSPYTRGLEFTFAMMAVLFVGAFILCIYLLTKK
jgi:hypothetical protein